MSDGHPIPPTICVKCGYMTDRGSNADPTSEEKAHENAVAICMGCGHLSVFAADLRLRPFTEEDAKVITREMAIDIFMSQMAVLMMRKEHPLKEETKQ